MDHFLCSVTALLIGYALVQNKKFLTYIVSVLSVWKRERQYGLRIYPRASLLSHVLSLCSSMADLFHSLLRSYLKVSLTVACLEQTLRASLHVLKHCPVVFLMYDLLCCHYTRPGFFPPTSVSLNSVSLLISVTKLQSFLWAPDVKSGLIGKDPDSGKDRRRKEKRAAEDDVVR